MRAQSRHISTTTENIRNLSFSFTEVWLFQQSKHNTVMRSSSIHVSRPGCSLLPFPMPAQPASLIPSTGPGPYLPPIWWRKWPSSLCPSSASPSAELAKSSLTPHWEMGVQTTQQEIATTNFAPDQLWIRGENTNWLMSDIFFLSAFRWPR